MERAQLPPTANTWLRAPVLSAASWVSLYLLRETRPRAELPSDPSDSPGDCSVTGFPPHLCTDNSRVSLSSPDSHPTASLTSSVPGRLTGTFSILTHQNTTLSIFLRQKLLPTSAISAASICLLKADAAASPARPTSNAPNPKLISHRVQATCHPTAAAASSRASLLLCCALPQRPSGLWSDHFPFLRDALPFCCHRPLQTARPWLAPSGPGTPVMAPEQPPTLTWLQQLPRPSSPFSVISPHFVSVSTQLPSPTAATSRHLVSGRQVRDVPHGDVNERHHVRVVEDGGGGGAGKHVLQELEHGVRRLRLVFEDAHRVI